MRLGDGVTYLEAKQRCQKHAQFLLAHFNRDETIKTQDGQGNDLVCGNWKATSFYKWMHDTNPTLSQKLKDAEEARKKHSEAVPTSRLSHHQSSTVMTKAESEDDTDLLFGTTAAESDRARRTRERATRLSQESDIEMKDAPPARAPARIETPIYPPQIPMRAATSPAASSAPHTPTVGRKGHELLDVPEDPVQSFLELLEEILEKVGGDVSKVSLGRVNSHMYMNCSVKDYAYPPEVSRYYAKELTKRLPPKWHRSPYFRHLVEVRSQPWTSTVLTEDMIPSQLRRRRKMAGASKPRLRDEPAGTPYMGKRLPATPRTGGLTVPVKRPRINYAENYEDNDQPSKHARFSGDSEEETSEDEQLNDSSDAADVRRVPNSTTRIPPPPVPKETVHLVVRAEKIPTASPTGPNGTWRCDEDGCGFVVRSAEEPEGRILVEKHFQDHADRVEKVNIALAEGTRGNLPIKYVFSSHGSYTKPSK